MLSICIFIPKKLPDTQLNWTIILVNHVFFSHTIKSQTTFTENIISIMCCIHMHTILAIQLGRIHSSVHWIQLWNLLRNAGGPSVLPTTLLHATDCSRSLEVISWMQKVSFYGSSWIAIDDFLTCVYLAMILPFCIPISQSWSPSRDFLTTRESLPDLIFVQAGPFILFLHLYVLYMYITVF